MKLLTFRRQNRSILLFLFCFPSVFSFYPFVSIFTWSLHCERARFHVQRVKTWHLHRYPLQCYVVRITRYTIIVPFKRVGYVPLTARYHNGNLQQAVSSHLQLITSDQLQISDVLRIGPLLPSLCDSIVQLPVAVSDTIPLWCKRLGKRLVGGLSFIERRLLDGWGWWRNSMRWNSR